MYRPWSSRPMVSGPSFPALKPGDLRISGGFPVAGTVTKPTDWTRSFKTVCGSRPAGLLRRGGELQRARNSIERENAARLPPLRGNRGPLPRVGRRGVAVAAVAWRMRMQLTLRYID
jgi:hypothetical protein